MEEDKVYFIGHQSNLLVLQSVVSGVGISPTQQSLQYRSVCQLWGSTGTPVVFSQHWESFKSGD
ncbi:hypothetical protein [Candidatus Coxiella mudrowiae]|uniref:hypothetical protein n=1 Tax=Candidatus Coxiella mudrowiae TaxID=2054173 RepID=UPI0012FE90E5|nr:hypothetical protein [Candidatus Coxiella mudrowiae]